MEQRFLNVNFSLGEPLQLTDFITLLYNHACTDVSMLLSIRLRKKETYRYHLYY